MPHKTAFASELPWPDYHAAVRHGATPILIPIGSMEQHGHHMPLHVDVLLPTEFDRRAALMVGGMVAPPFTYGYKSHQKSGGGNHLPGTTSLDDTANLGEPCHTVVHVHKKTIRLKDGRRLNENGWVD